jgi:hypothetical protein
MSIALPIKVILGLKYMCWSKINNFLGLIAGCMQCQSSPWLELGQLQFPWQPSYGKSRVAVGQHTFSI